IIGFYWDATDNRVYHGFLYNGGTFTSLEHPNGFGTEPRGINDSGQIVGLYSANQGETPSHGFLYNGGNFTTVDYPNASLTFLVGINNSGHLSGYSFNNLGAYGFLATQVT